ncbi:MAG: energy-coupling factor transporter ATPase [Lachnospiraceae bacterium]|nr:energy-coupling factor transporter ATPase [Lachnospiraceae bacterium]
MSIIFNHVYHSYDADTQLKTDALSDISFKIDDGEFVGLIGHTGSGKSTLVQHMNGLMKPTKGEVYFDGKDISDKDYPIKELRSSVGLVFQYPEHQLFEATVFEDVCFGPLNQGLEKKDAELRAFTALRQVGLEETTYYQSPFDLSGGQKRRAAIAGVLAMRPRVLVLDEPTAGLDPKGRDEILSLVKKLHDEEKITIVLVSHSMDDVANYVDRILVMNKSRLVYDAPPKEVFTHAEELEQMGLAIPSVTYAMHALKKNGFDVPVNVTTIDEAVEKIMDCIS